MYRKILVITTFISILICLAIIGCKKKTQEPVQVKTEAQYQAEAEKEINDENMQAELEKLEKEVEADIATEQ